MKKYEDFIKESKQKKIIFTVSELDILKKEGFVLCNDYLAKSIKYGYFIYIEKETLMALVGPDKEFFFTSKIYRIINPYMSIGKFMNAPKECRFFDSIRYIYGFQSNIGITTMNDVPILKDVLNRTEDKIAEIM